MSIYYLSSVDGIDGGADGDGSTWDKAFATLKYAVETASAAASGPHLLYVDSAHSESLSADTTITAAGDLRILCVNRSTGALATTALVGAGSSSRGITIAGAFVQYFYGIIFANGGGTGSDNLSLNNTDGGHVEYEACAFQLNATGTSSAISPIQTSSGISNYTKLTNCVFKFSAAAQKLIVNNGTVEMFGCSVDSAGTAPTVLFVANTNSAGGAGWYAEGCDFSHVGSGTLVGDSAGNGVTDFKFVDCKFGSGMTIKAAAATILHKGNCTVVAFNCNSGDAHYSLYHADAFGETTVSNTIYANDGAAYDSTNKCSWKIVTTANCSYYTPYVSPWMDVYHSGTSAISPYLEILRSGSTTKYQNDEVWSEFSYQGTSGSTKATIVSDRMTPLGTAADQTASSLDASGWTGEDATNNAYMKLEAGSITPAEIGHIRARVVVGEPSITVYADPKIRGLS